jgi:DNA-binding MarR family transcriptional regulator
MADDQRSDLITAMSSDPLQAEKATDPTLQPMLAERVGYLLAKLHHRWAGESIAALADAGVGLTGMHFGALSIVDGLGPMSQQELGEYIGKDRTTIVAIVDELEQAGLVERRRNPADRRAYALEVTTRGHDWLARAKPVLLAAEDGLLEPLGDAEREVLMDLMRRVLLSPPPER